VAFLRVGAAAAVVAAMLGAGFSQAARADGGPLPSVAPAVGDDLGPIAPDPDVRQGTLANGLRYAVKHNGTPSGAVAIRLTMIAGSYDEEDDQMGVAHFIEHMAFNGTKRFPEGSLDTQFAAAGVQFGRDQNADTSLSITTYRLDLNHADPQKLDLSFLWLRDVADGMTLSQEAVEHERGVILSEREARLSPAQAQRNAVERFRQPGSRTAERPPIGTVASISTMSSARLRAFYDRWYRPDYAVVVVVGDASAEDLEKRVKDTFGSWQGRGPTPTRHPRTLPDPARGLDVLTRGEPQMASGLSACRLREPDNVSLRTVRRLRRLTIRDAWTRILNERLARLASNAAPPFLRAGVSFEGGREAADACLLAAPLNDAWDPALDASAVELTRFALHGPTQQELDQALADQRSAYLSARAGADTRWTTGLANSILNDVLSGDVVATPAEKLRAFDVAMKAITPDLVKAEFAADWAGNGPLISVVAPQAPEPQAVRAAWTTLSTAPAPAPYVSPKTQTWAYTDFGPVGHVARREVIQDPTFVRLSFQNGVVLNFKQTDFRKGDVQVRVRFGAGRRELPDSELQAAQFGAGLLVDGGLGRYDADQLRVLFSNESWEPALEIDPDAFVLKAGTSPTTLGHQLQVLSAFLTDPGFRPEVDARAPTAVDLLYRRIRTTPGLVMADAWKRAVSPGDPETLPPEAAMQKLRSSDFRRLFKPALTQAPLEVTIVGDIDEATAVRLTAATLGALPARKATPRAKPDTHFLRFPEGALAAVRATHEGPEEKAVVGVVWPLYMADPSRRREEYALNLVAHLLSDDLRHRVRQQLGKTYSPNASAQLPDHADQGFLIAVVETAPADVDQVAAEVRESARKLATGGVTPQTLEAVRAPLLAGLDTRVQTNAWWLSALDGSAANPGQLAEATGMRDLYRSITLDEVKAAARTWLARAPLVVTVVPAAAHTAAAS
jgi:zinc protease